MVLTSLVESKAAERSRRATDFERCDLIITLEILYEGNESSIHFSESVGKSNSATYSIHSEHTTSNKYSESIRLRCKRS